MIVDGMKVDKISAEEMFVDKTALRHRMFRLSWSDII